MSLLKFNKMISSQIRKTQILARLTALALIMSGGLAFVFKSDELAIKLPIVFGTMKTCKTFNGNCFNSKIVGL